MEYQEDKKNKALAIIPARGGSKGIPRKNLADLGGRPLIAYSIEVALEASNIDRVIVSTDDEEIAAVSRELGADVPFIRPDDLAGDRSSLYDVTQHLLDFLCREERYLPTCYCMLMPTSPFRITALVDALVDKLFQDYSHVVTTKALTMHRYSYFEPHGDGVRLSFQSRLLGDGETMTAYKAFGVFSGHSLKKDIPTRRYSHVIEDPVSLIDIDHQRDLELARAVVRNNLFPLTQP